MATAAVAPAVNHFLPSRPTKSPPGRRSSKPIRTAHSSYSLSSSSAQAPAPPTTTSHAPPPPAIEPPYYGHEVTAKICARFISALFACSDSSTSLSTSSSSTATPPLAHFVAYALHRTRLPELVTYAALFLLARLKSRFPAARGSSGHRLFISAFMIASKVICDDTYSNKSWCIVGQGLFTLKEVNQMEREMCGYLEWVLNVNGDDLQTFHSVVKRDYGPSNTAPPRTNSLGLPSGVQLVAPKELKRDSPMSSPSDEEPISLPSPACQSSSQQHSEPQRQSSLNGGAGGVGFITPPMSCPPTPGSSHSTTSTPASSISCLTPQSMDFAEPKIVTPTSIAAHDDFGGVHNHYDESHIIRQPSLPALAPKLPAKANAVAQVAAANPTTNPHNGYARYASTVW